MFMLFLLLWIALARNICGELDSVKADSSSGADPSYPWSGKWFPHPPQKIHENEIPDSLKDPKHGVVMGKPNKVCDDGKTNIEKDWNFSPINFTCFTPKTPFEVRYDLKPTLECDDIPRNYIPQHHCMSETLEYKATIPTHEGHRPLWPVYGEYLFVPPQRWLHSLEHGAIVMLYHPCAPNIYVKRLKTLVKSCIRKHIITPYTLLPKDRPLALVAWGCRFLLPYVDIEMSEFVIKFIRERALHGGEGHYSKEGQYDTALMTRASVPVGSDYDDKVLCPFLP